MEPSRKEKRIESKKRKAKAFLELTKQIEEVDNQLKDSDEECASSKQPKMSEVNTGQSKPTDEWAQYKKLLREKKKAIMEKPKVYLILDDLQFQHSRQMSQDLTFKEMPPLFILDLQHLLLFALQGNVSSYKPRWCKLLRVGKVTSVVVIVLDSVSSYEFQTYPDCFPRLKAEFDMSMDMVCPEQYGSSVCEDLFNVPLSNSVLYKLHGRIPNTTMKMIHKFTRAPVVKPVKKTRLEKTDKEKIVDMVTEDQGEKPLSEGFTNADVDEGGGDVHKNDCFTRTSLLLSSSQMIVEDLPLPIQYNKLDTYKDFVFSRDTYSTVTSQSQMFAVDCEMVITSEKRFELARVSVINESLETVYDTFVKPYNKVVDYVTRYSGVTKFILDPVKTRLEDVQKFFKDMLPPDAILCGQSLKGDLTALKMFHPYVIDTSVIFNLSGHRSQKTGLKRLAAHFLGKEIQESDEGHSSVEDAVTTMELVQLKLKQSPDYGDIVNGGSIPPHSLKDSENSSSKEKQEDQTSSSSLTEKQEDNTTSSNQCTEDNTTSTNQCTEDNTTSTNQCTDDKNIKGEGADDSKSSVHNKTLISENTEEITENGSIKDKKCSDTKPETTCTCDETKTDNVVRCKSCQKKIAKNRSKKNLIQQRKAFFQQAGSQVYESFIKLMQKHNKMVGLIDRTDTLEKYKDDTMTAVPTTCDRDTKSAGKSLTQFHDFVYMNFPSYRDTLKNSDEEEKQKLLRKQDKRISKVLKHVRTNSLVAIVMTGRCIDGQDFNARTFVKIT